MLTLVIKSAGKNIFLLNKRGAILKEPGYLQKLDLYLLAHKI